MPNTMQIVKAAFLSLALIFLQNYDLHAQDESYLVSNWDSLINALSSQPPDNASIFFAASINANGKEGIPSFGGGAIISIDARGNALVGNNLTGFSGALSLLTLKNITIQKFVSVVDDNDAGTYGGAVNATGFIGGITLQTDGVNDFVEFLSNAAIGSAQNKIAGGGAIAALNTTVATVDEANSVSVLSQGFNFFSNSVSLSTSGKALGGAIYAASTQTQNPPDPAQVELKGNVNFKNNSVIANALNSLAAGGAVAVESDADAAHFTIGDSANADLTNVNFSQNSVKTSGTNSQSLGGGVFWRAKGGALLSFHSITNFNANSVIAQGANSQGLGGAIFIDAADADMDNSATFNNSINLSKNSVSVSGAYSQGLGGGFFASALTGLNAQYSVSAITIRMADETTPAQDFIVNQNSLSSNGLYSQAAGGGLAITAVTLGSNASLLNSGQDSVLTGININVNNFTVSQNSVRSSYDYSQNLGGGMFLGASIAGGDSAKNNLGVKVSLGDADPTNKNNIINASTLSIVSNSITGKNYSQNFGGGLAIAAAVAGGGGAQNFNGNINLVFGADNSADPSQTSISYNNVSGANNSQNFGGGLAIAGVVANGYTQIVSAQGGSVDVQFYGNVDILNNKVSGGQSFGGGFFAAAAVSNGANGKANNSGGGGINIVFEDNVNISQNSAAKGGGIFITGALASNNAEASPSALNVSFGHDDTSSINISRNSASIGGGLYAATLANNGLIPQNVTINFAGNIVFANNTAQTGAAIYAEETQTSKYLSINFSDNSSISFIGNNSTNSNGVIFWMSALADRTKTNILNFSNAGKVIARSNIANNGGFLALNGAAMNTMVLPNGPNGVMEIIGNSARNAGGAFYLTGLSTMVFATSATVNSNSANYGGAIYIDGAQANVILSSYAEFSHNRSNYGNGIIAWPGIKGAIPVDFSAVEILKANSNYARRGGFLYLDNNNLHFYNTKSAGPAMQIEIRGNTAFLDGGAIYAVNRSTILFVSGDSGGFYNNKAQRGNPINNMPNDIFLANNSAIIFDSAINEQSGAIDINFTGGIYATDSIIVSTNSENAAYVKMSLSGYNYFSNTHLGFNGITVNVSTGQFIYTNGAGMELSQVSLDFYNVDAVFANYINSNQAVINVVRADKSQDFTWEFAQSRVTFSNNTSAIRIERLSQEYFAIAFASSTVIFENNGSFKSIPISWSFGAGVQFINSVVIARNNKSQLGGLMYLDNGRQTEIQIPQVVIEGDISFYNNVSASSGGVIAMVDGVSASVGGRSLNASNNIAATKGGVFYVRNSDLSLMADRPGYSILKNNRDANGAHFNDIHLDTLSTLSITTLKGSVFSFYDGLQVYDSTVYFRQAGQVNILGDNVFKNASINIVDGANVNIKYEPSWFTNFNFQDSNIRLAGGANLSFILLNPIFANNVLDGSREIFSGGVISAADSGFFLKNANATFVGNKALNHGGAIYNVNTQNAQVISTPSVTHIENSVVFFRANQAGYVENDALGMGGAIAMETASNGSDTGSTGLKLNIIRSYVMFDSNTALSSGGAVAVADIYNEASIADKFASVITFNIAQLTFINNQSQGTGGAIYNTVPLNISNRTNINFINNQALSGGAWVNIFYIQKDSNISDSRFIFSGNKALGVSGDIGTLIGAGGAMYVDGLAGSNFNVNRSIFNFEGNTAQNGGALAIGASQSEQPEGMRANFNDSTLIFNSNVASSSGGAMLVGLINPLYITPTLSEVNFNSSNISFSNNMAASGGAAAIVRGIKLGFNNSNVTFDSNYASKEGGAIYMNMALENDNAPQLSFINSNIVFSNNSAPQGAAIFYRKSVGTANNEGGIVFKGSTVKFINNRSSQGNGIIAFDDVSGGVVYASINFYATDVYAVQNEAVNGGFMYLDASLSNEGGEPKSRNRIVEFSGNNLFAENRSQNGGAFFLTSATVDDFSVSSITFGAGDRPTYTTFAGNIAASSGGAIYLQSNARVEFKNTYLNVYGNSAGQNGGFIHAQDTSFLIGSHGRIYNNRALNGGAISFTATQAQAGQDNILEIHPDRNKVITFSANKAQNYGGAIYAAGFAYEKLAVLHLNGEYGNIIFKNNFANGGANDIYLDRYSELRLDSQRGSVLIYSGVEGAADSIIRNVRGNNVLGGRVHFGANQGNYGVFVTEGVLNVSAYAGTTTYAGESAAYIAVLTANGANSTFYINPTAGAKIADSAYQPQERISYSPRVNRLLIDNLNITEGASLDIGINFDENAYGQLILGGAGLNISQGNFNIVLDGIGGASAGTLIKSNGAGFGNNVGAGGLNFASFNIISDSDYKFIYLTTSTANGEYAKFAVIKYFDFVDEIKGLNENGYQSAKLLNSARKAGLLNADVADSLTYDFVPTADPDSLEARVMFDELAGTFIPTAIKQAAMDTSYLINQRLERAIWRSLAGDRYQERIYNKVWAQTFTGAAQLKKSWANPRAFDSNVSGAQAGFDAIVNGDKIVGAFGQFTKGNYKQGYDKGKSDGIDLGVYGAWYYGLFTFKGSLSGGVHSFETRRKLAVEALNIGGEYTFSGFEQDPQAEFNIYALKYQTEAEYIYELNETMDITPFVGFSGASLFNETIKENGEFVNLEFKENRYDRETLTYGITFSDKNNKLSWGARIYGGYDLSGAVAKYSAKYQGLPGSMEIQSVQEQDTFIGFAGGALYNFNVKWSAFVDADLRRNDTSLEYIVNSGVGYKFSDIGRRVRLRNNHLTDAMQAAARGALKSQIEDWLRREAAAGKRDLTENDAKKALGIRDGKEIFLVNLGRRYFYFDSRDWAEQFVNRLISQGVDIDRSAIRSIILTNDFINTIMTSQMSVGIYRGGLMEVAGSSQTFGVSGALGEALGATEERRNRELEKERQKELKRQERRQAKIRARAIREAKAQAKAIQKEQNIAAERLRDEQRAAQLQEETFRRSQQLTQVAVQAEAQTQTENQTERDIVLLERQRARLAEQAQTANAAPVDEAERARIEIRRLAEEARQNNLRSDQAEREAQIKAENKRRAQAIQAERKAEAERIKVQALQANVDEKARIANEQTAEQNRLEQLNVGEFSDSANQKTALGQLRTQTKAAQKAQRDLVEAQAKLQKELEKIERRNQQERQAELEAQEKQRKIEQAAAEKEAKERLAAEEKAQKEILIQEQKAAKARQESIEAQQKIEMRQLAQQEKEQREALMRQEKAERERLAAEEKARQEEAAQQAKEEKERQTREAKEEKVRLAAEEKAQKEALAQQAKEEKERQTREAKEEKARLATEEKAQKEALAQQAREEKARQAQEAAEKKRLAAEQEAQKKTLKIQERQQKERQARLLKEEKAALEAEERAQIEAIARQESEERDRLARQKAAEKEILTANIEAERQAVERQEREFQARQEAAQSGRLAAQARSQQEAIALQEREEKQSQDRLIREQKASLAAQEKAQKDAIAEQEREERERQTALKAQQNAEKERLAAQAKAQKEALAQQAKEEKERQAREAKEEKARLAAEERAQKDALVQQAKEEKERQAREAKAEKVRLAAEEKAQKDALVQQAKEEKERQAREAKAEKDRLAAEAKAQREALAQQEREEKERQAALKAQQKAEKERLTAEAKAQKEALAQQEREEKARLAAQANVETQEEALKRQEREEKERQAREAKEEKARLAAEAKAQKEFIAQQKREEKERKAAERAAQKQQKARLAAEVKAQRAAFEQKEREAAAKQKQEEKERKARLKAQENAAREAAR